MQTVLTESPCRSFNWIQFCVLVGGLQSGQGVLCLPMFLFPPPLLNVLSLSSDFPSHSCPHALCKQLRVKEEVANCLRKEDFGWKEILLQRRPRGHISKCPSFLSLLWDASLVWFSWQKKLTVFAPLTWLPTNVSEENSGKFYITEDFVPQAGNLSTAWSLPPHT